MNKLTWPAWFNSPDEKSSVVFEKAEDVPAGWTSGAEKQLAVVKLAPVKEAEAIEPVKKGRGRPPKVTQHDL